jgi:RNA polymerase sigma-70 factor, ECF subfamily
MVPMNFSSFGEDYVRRLAEGDPHVEKHFTDYFGEVLHVKLISRLRSPQTVEDAMQETFLRVPKNLRDGDLLFPDRLGAFVNSVSNNVLFEIYRDRQKHDVLPKDPPEPADPSVNLERGVVRGERKEMVFRILHDLSAKDRELLKMIFLEERDRADICRQLNVTSEYLRVLAHRAKNRFREAMEESDSGRHGRMRKTRMTGPALPHSNIRRSPPIDQLFWNQQ